MEHILQFGVTIDDHAIEERAVSAASNAVAEELKKRILEKYYGGYGGLTSGVEHLIDRFLQNNKDEIIEKAAEAIVTKMYASKTIRGKILDAYKEEVSK